MENREDPEPFFPDSIDQNVRRSGHREFSRPRLNSDPAHHGEGLKPIHRQFDPFDLTIRGGGVVNGNVLPKDDAARAASRRVSQFSPTGELCLNFLLRCIVAPFVSPDSFLDAREMNILQCEVLIERFADQLRTIAPLALRQRIQAFDLILRSSKTDTCSGG